MRWVKKKTPLIKDKDEIKEDSFYSTSLFNVGNYEISNRGYTRERDKASSKKNCTRCKVLSGLVTEDEHPDWSKLIK